MKTLLQIYEKNDDVTSALKELEEFSLFGMARLSDAVVNELESREDQKKIKQWRKISDPTRLSVQKMAEWVKKNV